MTDQPRRNGDLMDVVADAATMVGRISYGLMRLPLGLLPAQSRRHMDNALRELSYAFVRLPADFAEVAEVEIERWVAEGEHEESRQKSKTTQHMAVDLAPLAVATPTSDIPDLATLVPEAPTDPVAAIPQPTSVTLEESLTAPMSLLTISHIEFDPPGRDLDGEYVQIHNTSTQAIDLDGWRLHDGDNKHTYVFPALQLAPGAAIKLWSTRGNDDGQNLYWNNTRAIWNNSGDTATLIDAEGNIVFQYTYSGRQ